MKTLVLFLVIGSALMAGETWSDIDYKAGVSAMQLALDAQLTREASYGQGSLSGTIDVEGQFDVHGAVNLVWDESHVYAETLHFVQEGLSQEGAEGKRVVTVLPHEYLIVSPQESWLYTPSLNSCLGNGIKTKRKLFTETDIRPLMSWSTYSSSKNSPLSKIIKGFSDPGQVPATRFQRSSEGLIKLHTASVELVVSVSSGDLLRYSVYPREGVDSPMADTKYHDTEWEWVRDAHGVPYCQTWTMRQYQDATRTDVLLTKRIHISQYDSNPPAAKRIFTLNALKPALGTVCTMNGPTGLKSWKYGVQKKAGEWAAQHELDKLIRQAQSQGFSAQPVPSGQE